MKQRALTWSLILLAALAILFGGLWRQETARREAYEKAYLSQLKIDELGPGFESIGIRVTTEPCAHVKGTVKSDADLSRLKAALAPLIGSRLAVDVKVSEPSTQ